MGFCESDASVVNKSISIQSMLCHMQQVSIKVVMARNKKENPGPWVFSLERTEMLSKHSVKHLFLAFFKV